MENPRKLTFRNLPRNLWSVSLTSFFMDISSEMVINILPLFLSNVLGVRTNIIGIIEGFAETTSSLLKLASGWLSDKLGSRKWLAVSGYVLSTLSKPFFYFANSWGMVAGVRWVDRLGKGIRTAPRDALVADSIEPEQRGLAFGLHRAADTGGALLGFIIALCVVYAMQGRETTLQVDTFRLIVLISLVPAVLSVLSLALIAKEVPKQRTISAKPLRLRELGRSFGRFLIIVALFELGNASDAFLVLRAQERGISVVGVLGVLVLFNLIYTLISTPAGSLSDRIPRKKMVVAGWLVYGLIYLGFALAQTPVQIWVLYAFYGAYYGLTYGTTKALVADIVPEALRGSAYGAFNAALGLMDLPASLIAGFLWEGWGGWQGFGPQAPFLFSAVVAVLAALMLAGWQPGTAGKTA